MAGNSAKKLAQANAGRLHTLKRSLIISFLVHLVLRIALVGTDVNVRNLHPKQGWLFLGAVNAFAWLSFLFLKSLATGGTSLTSATAGGARSRSGPQVAWWIENLQDIIFLCAGTNVFSAYSMKAGATMLGLVPLYGLYLIFTLFKGSWSSGSNSPVQSQDDADGPTRRKRAARQTTSTNKTR
jgi:hypothetical protein